MKRTVKLGLMAYVDADGVNNWGFAGDQIDVHPEHVERFDSLNVLSGDEAADPPVEPKRTRTRKASN